MPATLPDLDTCAVDTILMQRKALRRQLAAAPGLRALRIAVLGGSTTGELVNLLEILLLASGFAPVFYQSEYGRFYEEAVLDAEGLEAFQPDLVYVHTSFRNVQNVPPIDVTEAALAGHVAAEMARFRAIWDGLERLGCQVIQNNFDPPAYALLGNLEVSAAGGHGRLCLELNGAFAREAAARPRLLLQDLQRLAAEVGLRRWFDWGRFFSYKLLYTAEANLEIARSLNAMVRAMYGKARKVLVLDLDNTLWGGVIGEDGVERIQIGRETPVAEAYTAFQEYCLRLRERGILLAVCSKNKDAVARSGFAHPSSVLRIEHFSCFKANWEAKDENILAIAEELNLGVESFVFVDDNPAERALVRAQLPGVAVPEVGDEVVEFARVLEAGRYFESAGLSAEDLGRAGLYAENAQRAASQGSFASYGEYLDSLGMVAEIGRFQPLYLERIAQLTNKTNQFNLTTRRYTLAEIEAAAADPGAIALYGRLADRFGENGLVSVVLGRIDGEVLRVELWLMSCRVLKREMEVAMLDVLVAQARARGVRTILGSYVPSAKNGMVADHYAKLGFLPAGEGAEGTRWVLALESYTARSRHISITPMRLERVYA